MAIVRPTVGASFVADPRQERSEKKWDKIHGNTMSLASMAIQAKLRQEAIEQALQSAQDDAEIAAEEKRLTELTAGMTDAERAVDLDGYASQTMGGTGGLPAGAAPPSTVQNQERLSAMLAQGAPGSAQADMMAERMAKMLQYEQIASKDADAIGREQMRESMMEAEGDEWRLAAQEDFEGNTPERFRAAQNAQAIRDLVNQMGGSPGGMRWAMGADEAPPDLYAQNQAARLAMREAPSPHSAQSSSYAGEMGEAGRARRIEEILRRLKLNEMNRLGWGNIGGGSGMQQTWGPGLSPRD